MREQQAAMLEIRLAQANLRALKMQLHPHFLFNTLKSIAALVRKNENRTAIKMLVQLGDFLRLALENKGVQEITLQQELDFLERYLDIEKIRFQERLTVCVEAEPAVLDAYVPNMILQPLVENAIHHGIAPHADAGRIEIRAHLEDGQLVMQVRDDGPGLDPNRQSRREGVGLTNIRERLENLYGKVYDFSLHNAEEGGLVAGITIPFVTQPVMPTKDAA
jgi:LytS/YehU family sensor histidine kinase